MLRARMRHNFDREAVAVLIAISAALFILPLAFGRIDLWGDDLIQNLPLRLLAAHLIDGGHLPLWNSLIWSGTPLLAGFNAGALHPLTLLFALFPPAWAWAMTEAVTFSLGAAGLYSFLRAEDCHSWSALVGSLSWTLGGAFGAQWVHIATVEAVACIPWALLGARDLAFADSRIRANRGVALLAMSGGLILLSGSPEIAVYGLMPVLLYSFSLFPLTANYRRLVYGGAAAFAMALMIGAVQWLPGFAFITASQRAHGSFAFFNSFSLSLPLTILAFFPYILGGYGYGLTSAKYFGPHNLPEMTAYVGVLPLIAFFATLPGWRRLSPFHHARVWHIIAIFSLVLAWGGNTPLGVLLYHLPGYGLLRDQSRNLYAFDLSLAVLTALWLEKMSDGISHPWLGTIPIVAICAAALSFLIDPAKLMTALAGLPVSPSLVRAVAPAVWVSSGLALAGGSLIVLGRRQPGNTLPVTIFMLLDLGVFATGQYWTHPVSLRVLAGAQKPWSMIEGATRNVGRIAIYDPSLGRRSSLNAWGQPDLNIPSGIASVQGYGSMVSKRYFAATGAHDQLAYTPGALAGKLPNLLNLRLLLARPHDFSHPAVSAFPHFTRPRILLQPYQSQWLYLGRSLALRQILLQAQSGQTPARLQIRTVGGPHQFLDTRTITVTPYLTRAAVGTNPHEKVAAIKLSNLSPHPLQLYSLTVMTAQGSLFALQGALLPYVHYPQWLYRRTRDGLAMFNNREARGWAWLLPSRTILPLPAAQLAHLQQGGPVMNVHFSAPAQLIVSQTYTPGWYAAIYRPGQPPVRVPAHPDGVIQQYRLPRGSYHLQLVYRPTSCYVGLALSVAGFVILGVSQFIGRRRYEYTLADVTDPHT